MNTNLLYLNDTYLLQENAEVIVVGMDSRGPYLVLDRTIFYPRGGGQEEDKGKIYLSNGKAVVIDFVKYESGIVYHYTESELTDFEKGTIVKLVVEKDRRMKCAATHTAGHLICGIMSKLIPHLKPVKGYHFLNGSYVEFQGEIENSNIIDILQMELYDITTSNCEVVNEIVTYDTLLQKCTYIPNGLPIDKPLRIITIGNFEPLPCGGTHVSNTCELNTVLVEKMKKNKEITRISYKIVN